MTSLGPQRTGPLEYLIKWGCSTTGRAILDEALDDTRADDALHQRWQQLANADQVDGTDTESKQGDAQVDNPRRRAAGDALMN